ncbi:MAG TPA: type II secretion system protein GspE, partial [Gammaproteobacteria bacterium]|nr:type II secretion system protein GspE [Gammaproteobacteria bacterium]
MAITADSDPGTAGPVLSEAQVAVRGIPFPFAKRHGVLVEAVENGTARVVHRQDVTSEALLETRRVLGLPLMARAVSNEEFDTLLQQAYEEQTNSAMQMMEGLDENVDLFSVAQALPEPEDLLESEDDAPIIRLINALLTEAVKENASD